MYVYLGSVICVPGRVYILTLIFIVQLHTCTLCIHTDSDMAIVMHAKGMHAMCTEIVLIACNQKKCYFTRLYNIHSILELLGFSFV